MNKKILLATISSLIISTNAISSDLNNNGDLSILVSEEAATFDFSIEPKRMSHNTRLNFSASINTEEDSLYRFGIMNINDTIRSKLKFNDNFIIGTGVEVSHLKTKEVNGMTNLGLRVRAGFNFQDVFNQSLYADFSYSPQILSTEKQNITDISLNYSMEILKNSEILASYSVIKTGSQDYEFENGIKLGVKIRF